MEVINHINAVPQNNNNVYLLVWKQAFTAFQSSLNFVLFSSTEPCSWWVMMEGKSTDLYKQESLQIFSTYINYTV